MMSVGEAIGLAITAGLFGGAVGAVAMAWITGRRQRVFHRRTQLLDAHARWLAGHMTLSRASASFVASFRSLAVEPRDSTFFSLRVEEAQRARAGWCDAMRELDLAEALLRAHAATPVVSEPFTRGARVEARALRAAINGSETDADQFVQDLRTADEAAIRFVEQATSALDSPAGPSAFRDLMVNVATHVGTITDRWSQR